MNRKSLAGEFRELIDELERLVFEFKKLIDEFVRLAGEAGKLAGEFVRLAGEPGKLAGEFLKLVYEFLRLAGESGKLTGEFGKLSRELKRTCLCVYRCGDADAIKRVNRNWFWAPTGGRPYNVSLCKTLYQWYLSYVGQPPVPVQTRQIPITTLPGYKPLKTG